MHKLLLTCIIAFIFEINATSQSNSANPQKSIDTAIDDCIRLLENKEYSVVLKKYVVPEDLEKILTDMSFEKLEENFAGDKAESLLNALKTAKGKRIEYNEDESVCTIYLGKVESGPDKIIFKKSDDLWYIADK
jgi:hypothetical protein